MTASARREAVTWLKSQGHSERRACVLVGAHRTTCRYVSRKPDRSVLITRLRQLAEQRPRFGYRRLHALLRREGQAVNRKLVYRLYREQGLVLRRRRTKKLRTTRPLPPVPVSRANERWSMDFVHDRLTNGRALRTFNVVDAYTRECLAIEVDTSLPAARVVRVLDALCQRYGTPETLRIDNGPEFISSTLDRWAYEHGVALHFIQPGKPTQNAHVESFNGRFRDECLAQAHFSTVRRARVEIALWRDDYNQHRPHSALGYRTPHEFAAEARSTPPHAGGLPAALGVCA